MPNPTLVVGKAADRIADAQMVQVGSDTMLSVPVVSVQDGPRMTGKPAFGGKKAAPFGSKKRAAKIVGKRMAAKKVASKTDLSVSGKSDIELGKDGAEWKHGYIPENAAALAIKEHRRVGDPGRSTPAEKKLAAKATVRTSAAKPEHTRYLSSEELKASSKTKLAAHAKAHLEASSRARTAQGKQAHLGEASAAKRELAKRKAAITRANNAKKAEKESPTTTDEKHGDLDTLTHAEIHARLTDPKTSEEDKITLKAESARRVAEAESIVRQSQEAVKEAKKELGEDDMADPAVAGRVFKTLERLLPAQMKPHLESFRTSKAVTGLKKGLALDQWATQALNAVLVPLVGAALGATLLH